MRKSYKIVIAVTMLIAMLMPTAAFAAEPVNAENCDINYSINKAQIQQMIKEKLGVTNLSDLNADTLKEYCKELISNTAKNKATVNKNNNTPAQKAPKAPAAPAPAPEAPKAPAAPAPKAPAAPAPEAPKAPAAPAPAPKAPAADNNATGSYEAQVADLVNKERAAQGLPALKFNAELSKVAEAKAVDLRDKGYFDHNSPTYGSPFDMMKQFGITYRSAGENIAKGYRTPDAVMNGWMNSPGHKANIMSGDFTEIGVGYVTDSSGAGYWVQMFIRP